MCKEGVGRSREAGAGRRPHPLICTYPSKEQELKRMRSLLVLCALLPVVVPEGDDEEGIRLIKLAGQGLQQMNTILARFPSCRITFLELSISADTILLQCRGVVCLDYFFCESRFKTKTIVCGDKLFLNPNLR